MVQVVKYIILFAFSFFLALPSSADKKDKSTKKHKVVAVDRGTEPDPIARKAKPDHHPRPIEQPRIFVVNDPGHHVHGIDVSHYQGRVNWDEVAREPDAGYVYLKATEGQSIVDNTYKHNFSECKRVGLKVGSYLFFRPQYSAKAQFELFRKTVSTRQQDLLPLVDAESMKGVSIHVFQSRLIELCELLEREYGVKPLIYTGQNFYNKNIRSNATLRGYKFFIARYDNVAPTLDGGDDYVMWQYTANGKMKGIRGYVDKSHFVGRHSLNEILYKK